MCPRQGAWICLSNCVHALYDWILRLGGLAMLYQIGDFCDSGCVTVEVLLCVSLCGHLYIL